MAERFRVMKLREWAFLVLFGVGVIVASPAWGELFPDAGPPGTTVTIGGADFGEFRSSSANRVEFHGTPALIQLWEPDMIMVKVPLAATTGPVTVVNGENRIEVGTFSVAQVRITRLHPREAEPGSILTIEGENFGNTAGSRDPNTMFGVNQVLINGIRAPIRKWRSTKIEVKIPANATSGDVVVKLASFDPLPDGSCCAPVDYVVSNPMPLTIIPPITFEPKHGPVGSKVVLSGQDLGEKRLASDGVLFGGVPATIEQWSTRTIVVHVPLNAKSGPVVLRHGERERTVGYFEVRQSLVEDVSPREGPIGTLVQIKGKDFGVYSEGGATAYAFDFNTGQNAVEIGGIPAIVHRWQDTEIDVWVPFSAKSGAIVIKRGATIPHPDGTCCLKRGVVTVPAGSFTVKTPRVTSYFPTEAGLDEIVTIKGSGFGEFLKLAEPTRLSLNRDAHDWKNYRLGENVSRSEVLINGVAAHVVSWTDTEIKVKVPRRHVFGIGDPEGFHPNPTTGEIVVRRGSWDLLENGQCCTAKRWIQVVAGPFTILRRGLPDPDYFNDPNPNRD
ncbi:MAG: hypothetical protein D6704_04875 [Nitrospirae bacterium]|nr:MAG: hypothetical protein D6704_04875 [Nitrospirota bacterium]